MDNESLVFSFMEISNLPIESAKQFLQEAGYNLELAIQNYYDSNTGTGSAGNSQTLSQNSGVQEEEEIRPVIPREYDTMIQSETARDIQLLTVRQQFSSSFRDLKREMELQEELARGQIPKRKCLEDIYRHPVDIAYNLDFHHAKIRGQQIGKWVAILINNENFESLAFNRDIFNEESQKVKKILKRNFIFLRKNCDDIEALKIMQIYNILECPNIPIFLIIDSVTGELRKNFGDCTKLNLNDILRELKKYSATNDNQLKYSSSFEDSDVEDNVYVKSTSNLKPSTSQAPCNSQQITVNKPLSTAKVVVESDQESFASLNSNDLSDDEKYDEDSQEAKIIDSDSEILKSDDGPQTNVLLRLQDESHKFKYPANRTVANLINYIYRNYLIQTGIYDNKTKRFSLISKIHNKCLTTLEQEKSLVETNIHPSIVLLHNTLDKD